MIWSGACTRSPIAGLCLTAGTTPRSCGACHAVASCQLYPLLATSSAGHHRILNMPKHPCDAFCDVSHAVASFQLFPILMTLGDAYTLNHLDQLASLPTNLHGVAHAISSLKLYVQLMTLSGACNLGQHADLHLIVEILKHAHAAWHAVAFLVLHSTVVTCRAASILNLIAGLHLVEGLQMCPFGASHACVPWEHYPTLVTVIAGCSLILAIRVLGMAILVAVEMGDRLVNFPDL